MTSKNIELEVKPGSGFGREPLNEVCMKGTMYRVKVNDLTANEYIRQTEITINLRPDVSKHVQIGQVLGSYTRPAGSQDMAK